MAAPGDAPGSALRIPLARGAVTRVADVGGWLDIPLSPLISCHAFDLGSAECIEAVYDCNADLDFGGLTVRIA